MLNVMFENSKGQARTIGTVENEESAFKVINDFYTIHYLKGDYVNCNYHKIDRSKDVEVLITNY